MDNFQFNYTQYIPGQSRTTCCWCVLVCMSITHITANLTVKIGQKAGRNGEGEGRKCEQRQQFTLFIYLYLIKGRILSRAAENIPAISKDSLKKGVLWLFTLSLCKMLIDLCFAFPSGGQGGIHMPPPDIFLPTTTLCSRLDQEVQSHPMVHTVAEKGQTQFWFSTVHSPEPRNKRNLIYVLPNYVWFCKLKCKPTSSERRRFWARFQKYFSESLSRIS